MTTTATILLDSANSLRRDLAGRQATILDDIAVRSLRQVIDQEMRAGRLTAEALMQIQTTLAYLG